MLQRLSQDQERRLQHAFELFDRTGSRALQADDLYAVLTALDVQDEVNPLELMSKFGRGGAGIDYQSFKDMIHQNALFTIQANRHYVLLSLTEAEHLRAYIHARNNMHPATNLMRFEDDVQLYAPLEVAPLIDNHPLTSCSLWHNKTSLATSRDFPKASRTQFNAALQSFRFVDSETDYDDSALSLLLRMLQHNTCEVRMPTPKRECLAHALPLSF